MAHSSAARKVLRELDKELAAASARRGQTRVWSAQEKAILAQISSILDRKTEFLELYEAAEDTKTKLKISAEVRLLEQAAARLIRGIKTDIEPAPSLRTVKARRAARARWDRDAHRIDADSDAGGYQLPGVYATLLAQERAVDGRPDPRYVLMDESDRPPLEQQARERSALLPRLQAGQPVIVPRWRLGGHTMPTPADVPMFTDRAIRWYKVTADDIVTPSGAAPV